jgi:hypothetical protein
MAEKICGAVAGGGVCGGNRRRSDRHTHPVRGHQRSIGENTAAKEALLYTAMPITSIPLSGVGPSHTCAQVSRLHLPTREKSHRCPAHRYPRAHQRLDLATRRHCYVERAASPRRRFASKPTSHIRWKAPQLYSVWRYRRCRRSTTRMPTSPGSYWSAPMLATWMW